MVSVFTGEDRTYLIPISSKIYPAHSETYNTVYQKLSGYIAGDSISLTEYAGRPTELEEEYVMRVIEVNFKNGFLAHQRAKIIESVIEGVGMGAWNVMPLNTILWNLVNIDKNYRETMKKI